ncbi:unnamed protein product [Rotaria sordida]|uniref:Kinesin motor domain-containing protein n=1 Tax=Rotaria sordida TaxID=392033 RepID=A0A818JSB2_9BILA|nr:unnamed protein product [Rotaria sordida]
MTKCLLKALKAVDLQNHIELFRRLGYDSAGALAHFHNEHFKQLNLSKQELHRFHALLDVLKEATREGKICPHYSKTHKQSTIKTNPIRAKSTESIQHRNFQSNKTNNLHSIKQLNKNLKSKRSSSSTKITERLSSTSLGNKNHLDEFILQRPSSSHIQQQKFNDQNLSGPKSFLNRAPIQHVKIKSYNYGIPTNKRQQNTSHHVHYQHEKNLNQTSIFVPSSHSTTDIISYAKPAEIYVFARKRPLLSNEIHFHDIISVPDNKRIIITENKANLDCTPLLKKSEFQFDQVFGSDTSNKQVFECTVLPFISTNHRQNLTYICFGQTGSGKSHTIFGSKNTDGLLIYCAQLLLQEINLKNKLICSFYEIYNNQLYDLCHTGKRLFAREDGEHSVNIVGITEIVLKNLDTLRSMINDGLTRRHHGKSAFNTNSSRSHAIFQLILKNNYNQAENFKLVFIDLAGSERAIDAQNNQRQTRREGAQINSSLLALKECIRSMDMTHFHAPFRQSKLTHILRDSLVGTKTRTCLMANVSPSDDCCQCSLNTLQYASRIRDISIRHRHRSMPITNIQRNYFHNDQEEYSEKFIGREESQRIFEPATASTPVHRLISSVDHQTYMTTNQTDFDTRKMIGTTKSPNIDWQIVDDDMPISGNDDNLRIKSVLSSTREFLVNTNTNNQNQSSSFYLTRYEQQRKKIYNQDGSPSSYFPLPQTDIKKSLPIQINENKTIQQWKTVPAPSNLPLRRVSDSSIEPPTSTRIIPIAPIQMSDDNQYSSTTCTESLGTKITKFATATHPYKKSTKQNDFIENLNFNKQSDTYTTTTITTDTDQGLYSDRQATHRDQTGFFSNRDDPLYSNDLKSNNLTTITQRTSPTTTPKNTYHKSDVISPSSKKSFSSPNKTHHRHRHRKSSSSSSSSTTSLTRTNNEKPRYSPSKRHHRIVPYHIHHSSDSDDIQHNRKTYTTRNEACQTINNIHIMKNEQEQTDDQLLLEQFSDQTSKNFMQTPLDQIKHIYDEKLSTSTSISKSLLPMTILFDKYPNRNGIIPLNNHSINFRRRRTDLTPVIKSYQPYDDNIFLPSPKNVGIRVTDQLNTLRTLLEKRLMEQDDMNYQTKDSSILQTSPKTFTKEFLQSYQQSTYKNNSNELISDLDDDDDDDDVDDYDYDKNQQIKRNFNYYDQNKNKYQSDVLSTSTTSLNQHQYLLDNRQQHDSLLLDDINQPKINLNTTVSSSTTLTPNFSTKIDTRASQVLSNSGNDINTDSSTNKSHHVSIINSDIIEDTHNLTGDITRTSKVNSILQNRYIGSSSGGSNTISSRCRSPVFVPSLNTFNITNEFNNGHDHLIDSGKGSSLLAGTSFDVLMNSLKSMREKDLDCIIHNSDDSLIRVTD